MNNDLVSREAVLNGKFDCLTTEVNREMYGRLSDIADYVKSIPAADAAKVAHGKWVDVAGGRTVCNNCGEYPLYDYFGRLKLSNSCPNCGARMDKEAEE